MAKGLYLAMGHQNWTNEEFRTVCFRDESTFECQQASAERVWHIQLSLGTVCQSVKHPTKVMVWSIISYEGARRIHICEGMMNAAKYLDVLENRMLLNCEHSPTA